MLVTSISLPENCVKTWRKKKRRIMRYALQTFRSQMQKNAVKRGVTRKYNRIGKPTVIVTVRLTQTEYDALHFVAASIRISVSLLVYMIIKNWRRQRRKPIKETVSLAHSLAVRQWNSLGASLIESLAFRDPESAEDFTLQGVC